MDEFKFNEELAQKIVDGILRGYSKYSEERIQKSRELHISGGYAWTKGNIIDHYTVEETKHLGIRHLLSKAGPTWGYLQFVSDEEKKLFIIKNQKYFNEKDFARGRTPLNKAQDKPANYLNQLSQINRHLDFGKIEKENHMNKTEQIVIDLGLGSLSLPTEDQEGLLSEFTEFYIVTYSINDDFKIEKINHYMPNPHNGEAIKIEDLSNYILTSEINIDTIDYRALKHLAREDQTTPAEFLQALNITLPGKEKEE